MMTLQEKLNFLEEIMDLDEGDLSEDSVLEEIDEWDSLATLALTVEIKKRYGHNLTTDMLKSFQTVSDICQFISDLEE